MKMHRARYLAIPVSRVFLAGLASICLGLPSAHAGDKGCEMPHRLKLSIVPQGGANQDASSLQPLVAALEKELKIPVEIMRPSSYGAVIEGLLSGGVDLARLGPASYITAKDADPGIIAFASYTRRADVSGRESASYHAVLAVRADRPYRDVQSLQGRKIALVDPDSTSGALIPRHMVRRQLNKPLEQHFGQVVYTGSHENSIKALADDEVTAAFVSSTHLSDMVEAGKVGTDEIRILWRSEAIPRDPFVYRGKLCQGIRKKIAAVFFKEEGRHFKLMLKNLKAIRVVPVSDQDYQIIRDISRSE